MRGEVEEITASLVREYLNRKGLKRTIACMDVELPRTDCSINNRSDLRRILHLDALYKKNKSKESPLKTLLELMVKEQMKERGGGGGDDGTQRKPAEEFSAKSALTSEIIPNNKPCLLRDLSDTNTRLFASSVPSQLELSFQSAETHSQDSSKTPSGFSLYSEGEKDNHLSPSRDDHRPSISVGLPTDRKTSDSAGPRSSRVSRMRRGMMAAPVASSSQEGAKRRPARKTCVALAPQAKNMLETAGMSGDATNGARWLAETTGPKSVTAESRTATLPEEASSPPPNSRGQSLGQDSSEGTRMFTSKSNTNKSTSPLRADGLHMSAVTLDDIDDEVELCGLPRVPSYAALPQLTLVQNTMDQNTAVALKEILFGSSMHCFNAEWKCQSFTFSDAPGLSYGIVQKKGGPCGVLASVQACLLQKLLFDEASNDPVTQKSQLSNAARTKCLTLAMADMLWRAGCQKQAIVTILSGRRHFTPVGAYKSDGILETISYMTAETFEELKMILEQHVHQYESGPNGCVLLTLSAVLSRSIKMVRKDMDVSTSTLIGAHGYCTQELVNLLLYGQAVSNVFNGDVRLDSGNGNFTLLKGIKSRCDTGLLSLFEHYNICKVGSHLKNPKYPIWVVCSESHFSVLFSMEGELGADECGQGEFDLFYYDGLANQQEAIRLTISTPSPERPAHSDVDLDLIPPLDLCIRTKWKNAVVSWNDTEPIL